MVIGRSWPMPMVRQGTARMVSSCVPRIGDARRSRWTSAAPATDSSATAASRCARWPRPPHRARFRHLLARGCASARPAARLRHGRRMLISSASTWRSPTLALPSRITTPTRCDRSAGSPKDQKPLARVRRSLLVRSAIYGIGQRVATNRMRSAITPIWAKLLVGLRLAGVEHVGLVSQAARDVSPSWWCRCGPAPTCSTGRPCGWPPAAGTAPRRCRRTITRRRLAMIDDEFEALHQLGGAAGVGAAGDAEADEAAGDVEPAEHLLVAL